MKRIILLIAATTLLSGCAQGVWRSHNGGNASHDLANCKYEAEKYGYVAQRGYGTGNAFAAGMEEGLRKSELTRQCMQNKGYYLSAN